MTAKELREKRAPLAATIRQMAEKVNSEGRDFNAEEQAQWDQVNNDYNALTAQIVRAERAEAVEAEQVQATEQSRELARELHQAGIQAHQREFNGCSPDDYSTMAIQAWFRSQLGRDLGAEHLEACHALGFNPNRRELTLAMYGTEDLAELQRQFRRHHPNQAREAVTDFKATLTGQAVGVSGGYLIPPATMIRQLEINMLAFGGMRQVAQTIVTTSGEPMLWPTADDTSNTGAQLGESTSIGSSVDPSFALVRWDAYKFSSKPILVPYELLEDSAFNLPSILGDMLGERLGRITNTRYTTGTGASQPKGITTAATLGVTAATATAITADELIDLYHSVDPAYRSGAGWMMNDAIIKYLRKLKDGEGNYLWQSGLQAGAPDRILGAPITENSDMASAVSGTNITLLFGQLSKYKIRRVNGLRLYRLQERYRDTDQDAFIAFIREDGNLLDAGTAPVKYMKQG